MQTVCTTSIIAYERYDKPTGRAQWGYVPHAVLLRQGSDDILENSKKEKLIPMEQYFDFTPYVTDTPVSFTITDESFMDFICEQLTAANIPFTKDVHIYKINDGGPIEGTEFIMPPSQAFSYAIITAPLTKSMVNRLMANNDHKTFNADSIMKNAYIA